MNRRALVCWFMGHRATPLAVGWASDIECERCRVVLALVGEPGR